MVAPPLRRCLIAFIAGLLVIALAGAAQPTFVAAAQARSGAPATSAKKHHRKHHKRKHHKRKRKQRRPRGRKHSARVPAKPAPVTTVGSTPTPAPAPAPAAPTGFTVGLVSGPAPAWELGLTSAANLHPKIVRVPFNIGTSASTVQSAVAALAAKGEQALPMAEFYGFIPNTSQAQSLANWARAVGPGGTFWQGRSDSYLAARYIEFGNETDGAYQFNGCGNGCSQFPARAQSYARALKDAQVAISGSGGNSQVGLLAVGDDHGPTTWVDNMYQAVPDLNSRVAGWTTHPYGPSYRSKVQNVINGLARHGAAKAPLFATEFGISSDNGRCLSDNYGWPKCMTYSDAATAMRNSLADMHAAFPTLVQLYVFAQRDMKSSGSTSDREGYFGALQSMGQSKGAFTTEIRNDLNSYRG